LLLTNSNKKLFHSYDHISDDDKESVCLPINDIGIDCTDLDNTLVQCKLYGDTISLGKLSTFLCQQIRMINGYPTIGWKHMILARNSESKLSRNIEYFSSRIQDVTVDSDIFKQYLTDIYSYYKQFNLVQEDYHVAINKINLRPYQIEAYNKIVLSDTENKNCILCLPTGTGKTIICLKYMRDKLLSKKQQIIKFLILVPTCQLLEQWYDEINDNDVCRVDHEYKEMDLLDTASYVICLYNSYYKVKHIQFTKIFIDECHHIKLPHIYLNPYDDYSITDTDITDSDSDNSDTDITDSVGDNSDSDTDNSDNTDTDTDNSDNTDTDTDSYIKIISKLHIKKNVVYLSATTDNQSNSVYYKYDLRSAINDGYISDYRLIIPIFNSSCHKAIAKYLLERSYTNVIVYAANREEGLQFNKYLNDICKCSEYIDCYTSKQERKKILNNFSNNITRFIVNIRVLSEGYNCPSATTCVFLHSSCNDIFIVQSIGRVLRKCEGKKFANVILPFANDGDDESIMRIINSITNTDNKWKILKQEKRLFDKIIIHKVLDIDYDDIANNDVSLRYEIIYNGIKEIYNVGATYWYDRLHELTLYIEEHNTRPPQTSKDPNIKRLAWWISANQTQYKTNTCIMSKPQIRVSWQEFINKYSHLFLTNEEIWYSNLHELTLYIEEHNTRPPQTSKDPNIKRLADWIKTNQTQYKTNTCIMSKPQIRVSWQEFINKYSHLFLTSYLVS